MLSSFNKVMGDGTRELVDDADGERAIVRRM